MKKGIKTNPPDHSPADYEEDKLQGYESYPESDDIYNKYREEKGIDPEDITHIKKRDKRDNSPIDIEEESNDDEFGRELDVPGSELDDDEEDVGNEDEENNYYSLGGDGHSSLDEENEDL